MPPTQAEISPRRLLVIGHSARALAQSAKRAGYAVYAVDAFGDSDTLAASYRFQAVPFEASPQRAERLLAAAEAVLPSSTGGIIVYGSGVDRYPALVEALARGRRLAGNRPAVLEQIANAPRFFGHLKTLRIPFPETRFTPPVDVRGWLAKSSCGEGGKCVVFAEFVSGTPFAGYFQKHIQGSAHSLLFLANGTTSRPIGLNTLWSERKDTTPYLYCGAINRTPLPESAVAALLDYSSRLTATLGLQGLNSLDVVFDGTHCWVLELNGRPSATMNLYDADYPRGLIAEHIGACQGNPPNYRLTDSTVRAERVVFAPRAITIPDCHWPVWSSDRPRAGTRVCAGEPLCSIAAEGDSTHSVIGLIDQRKADIESSLFPQP